jgi:hypothetical protein
MRTVCFAGVALAVVFLVANFAIELLNVPNDWSVMAGYFLLLALVSALCGALYRMWRRL